MNIALRYAKNKEEALEILNDGFLKAFLNLDKYDSDYPFRTWLRRIIINASIDYHRSHRRHVQFVELSTVEEIADTPPPLPKISPNEDMLPIIQKLPPAYRMVFNLFVIEGYKHQEIAELLNISVSTSKSNLVRAKAKLRQLLERQTAGKAKLN